MPRPFRCGDGGQRRVAATPRPVPRARRFARQWRARLRDVRSLRGCTPPVLGRAPHIVDRPPVYQATAYSEKWLTLPVTRLASRLSSDSRYEMMLRLSSV